MHPIGKEKEPPGPQGCGFQVWGTVCMQIGSVTLERRGHLAQTTWAQAEGGELEMVWM